MTLKKWSFSPDRDSHKPCHNLYIYCKLFEETCLRQYLHIWRDYEYKIFSRVWVAATESPTLQGSWWSASHDSTVSHGEWLVLLLCVCVCDVTEIKRLDCSVSREHDWEDLAVVVHEVHFQSFCDVVGQIREILLVLGRQDNTGDARSLRLTQHNTHHWIHIYCTSIG